MAKYGIYDYFSEDSEKKKSKKQKRKEAKKALIAKNKAVIKMCKCNHIARNDGKVHLKSTDDGYSVCKICGGKLLLNSELLTPESLEASTTEIYTVVSLIRNKLKLSDKSDEQLVECLKTVMTLPELFKLVKEEGCDLKKKKKKKDKKKKKKKGGKPSRVYY